jgi:hypothetical protein
MPKRNAARRLSGKGVVVSAAQELAALPSERPFIVSFCRKLQRGYGFTKMEKRHLKEFQSFLDKISSLSVSKVDESYKRKSDATDILDGQQVVHYEIADAFRLHGLYLDGRFEVVRIDPNHTYHD